MEDMNIQFDQGVDDSMHGKYLTFAVGDEVYGIEIAYVTEIIGVQAITEVPELPGYIKGIINLRGKIIPVLDVRLRFNQVPQIYDDRTCTIVIDINSLIVGVIVDTVLEVLSIEDDDIAPPPDARSRFSSEYINGIAKTPSGVKLLLDCDKLIGESNCADDSFAS